MQDFQLSAFNFQLSQLSQLRVDNTTLLILNRKPYNHVLSLLCLTT